MPDAGSSAFGQEQNRRVDPFLVDLSQDEDSVMEQILENIQSTPLGVVLKRIASLPEVRREKVLQVRRQITQGRYDVTERLDLALEKVLEDLTA
ncbi:MAG: flagellar biosynthesis anti-sigma factor FlgM [Planctomycetaceae bacterium]|nr:MAG: flagellar biosynthesis anti-sigma factor FlgM [Planctomycetaceae bacterium]